MKWGRETAMQKKKIRNWGTKKNKIQVSTQEMQEFGQKMVGLCTVQEKLSKMQSSKTNMGKVHLYQRVNTAFHLNIGREHMHRNFKL